MSRPARTCTPHLAMCDQGSEFIGQNTHFSRRASWRACCPWYTRRAKEAGAMSQRMVGIVINRLLTDQDLRVRFALDRIEMFAELCFRGFELDAGRDRDVHSNRPWSVVLGHRRGGRPGALRCAVERVRGEASPKRALISGARRRGSWKLEVGNWESGVVLTRFSASCYSSVPCKTTIATVK